MATQRRPTRAEIQAAAGKHVPDVIAPGLQVLFVGINPGLYSGAVGHHFARPGNRFWPALHLAGFTERILAPSEQLRLLENGYGITNIVNRATATAGELSTLELRSGAQLLKEKILTCRPHVVAILGIGAYRKAFQRPKATLGKQDEAIGDSILWVLPNPSGLNAHYQLDDLVELFGELRVAAAQTCH